MAIRLLLRATGLKDFPIPIWHTPEAAATSAHSSSSGTHRWKVFHVATSPATLRAIKFQANNTG